MNPKDIDSLNDDQLTNLILKYKFYNGDVKQLNIQQKKKVGLFVFKKENGRKRNDKTTKKTITTKHKNKS